MAKVLMDDETGTFYHPECRDEDDAGLVSMEEDGAVCGKCGEKIEDEGDPETLEEEEEGDG